MRTVKNVILFTLIVMNLVDQPAPEVTIDQGIVSGRISDDGLSFEYLGIPYATTNKSSRFRAPLPPPKWEGVFKATDTSSACPQNNYFFIRGTEDCLKINIFVPTFAKKPLAVMVFVHGGSFFLGDGGKFFFGPQFLLKEEVILVTFNYRLGILGFLCLGIEEAPGNAGLKDQVAALKWVKRNIEAFGGDSNKITVFGISAGAASVALLVASGKIDGIVNRAIIQSGSATAHWSIIRKPVWAASFVLKSLGYDTEDSYEIYDFLSNLSDKELASLPFEKPDEEFLDAKLVYLPCIEKSFSGTEALLPDYPYNLLKKYPTNISIIHGTTNEEGLFFIYYDSDDTIQYRNGKYLMASDLEFPTNEEATKVSNEIRHFYFREKNIDKATKMNLSELYKHLHFEVPSIMETEMITESGNAPIYNYYFSYSGNRNYLKESAGHGDFIGACHGDDLLYLFDGMFWPFKITEDDRLMIKRMTKLWSNYAKYGDPTPETSNLLPIKWEPSSKDKLRFFHIDRTMKMTDMPSPEAYQMWKNIYTKYRKTTL